MKTYQCTYFLAALATLALSGANGEITDQCRQETATLQENEDLGLAFEELLQEFKDDVESVCDFSVSGVDCGIDYSDENATFSALCTDAGGQIVDQNLRLNCELAGVEFGIGVGKMPFCVGASCNSTTWEASDLNDTRVDSFLDELSFSGCEATVSAGTQVDLVATLGLVGAAMLATVGGVL
ncbi:expressed unknown protein [Seminavis robusta]|uniref:Uncharacterized protein n=1 Tax=Seminavis robusta TaxID=568900 RepID=A0A9N8H5N4_9STRA|nr:expressed unknown protein [Seminavis robusta]|eukprot:Sro119_g058150.1 n/a (182) ;mRNA; f:71613-72158